MHTNLNWLKISLILYFSYKAILSWYNCNPLFFLNAHYTGATPTFNIEVLCFVTNTQLLKHLLQWIEQLVHLALVFLDRFPIAHFITKATPIIIMIQ